MSKKDEWKKSLENNIEQCDDYLIKAKDITDLVPDVEQRKKEDEAKLLFVTSMPEPVIIEFGDKLLDIQKHDEEQLRVHLPGLTSISPETRHFMLSGTSTSSEYLEIAQTYRLSDALVYQPASTKFPPPEVESIDKVILAFSDLADEKSKKLSLPPRLNKINKDLGDKFRVALQSFEKTKSGLMGIDQSAIQLRDVLEQLWGGLINLVREKDPRKYKGVELKLDPKGRSIVVDCLSPDKISGKKLTWLLETVSSIHNQISDSSFGKNPLTKDLEKLTGLYNQWLLVISDITDFVYLHLNIEV